jgi:hypothetical protein
MTAIVVLPALGLLLMRLLGSSAASRAAGALTSPSGDAQPARAPAREASIAPTSTSH